MAKKESFQPRGARPEVPRASSITARNMNEAYVLSNRRQRRRIEAFGQVNRETLRKLGARIVKRVR